jgi:MarR family 2-MHQ and catechol resistance regulon transcriptional repressor
VSHEIAPTDLFGDPRITAMGLFTEAFTGVTAKLATQIVSHKLVMAEFEVLLRLSRSPGGRLRMSDLAAQTSLTSGITRLIDRLERGGLVERTACPSDRRGLFAQITDLGRARMTAVLPGHLELIETWLIDLLEPDELDGFLGALRKIRDAVRPGASAGTTEPAPAPAIQ